jgi:hypothetical protein
LQISLRECRKRHKAQQAKRQGRYKQVLHIQLLFYFRAAIEVDGRNFHRAIKYWELRDFCVCSAKNEIIFTTRSASNGDYYCRTGC